jgi:hypothetical protein
MVGTLIEAVIGVVFISQKEAIHVPSPLIDTLFGLGIGRIVLLGLMVALLVPQHYRSHTEPELGDESQSLLDSSNGPAVSYGVDNRNNSKPPTKKARDAQSSGWFDYFAGFQVLFPYLW